MKFWKGGYRNTSHILEIIEASLILALLELPVKLILNLALLKHPIAAPQTHLNKFLHANKQYGTNPRLLSMPWIFS